MLSRAMIAALCLAFLAVAGCDDDDPSGPGGPDVTLQADHFRFQANGMMDVTDTLAYAWDNTGTIASVEQAAVITAGSAILKVLDADSLQVYSKNLADSGIFMTTSGVAGSWIIQVELIDLSGNLRFSAEKEM